MLYAPNTIVLLFKIHDTFVTTLPAISIQSNDFAAILPSLNKSETRTVKRMEYVLFSRKFSGETVWTIFDSFNTGLRQSSTSLQW